VIEAAPGTISVFSDIGCPWAHLAVYRLHSTRARLGLEDEVTFDMRAFPLELFNERPTPKLILDAEICVAGGLDPRAGCRLWGRSPYEWPVTTLPALEAVQAAKEQSLRASEQLDRALRVAFYGESRTISMHHEVVEVARSCGRVDAGELDRALRDGRARARIFEDKAVAEQSAVQGSPHLFLPDGSDEHNPGIGMRWEGAKPGGFPVVDKDRPEIYEDLLRRAAG
jgi:predicted DsbA family dithiol-disulfide isomerase